MKPDHFSLPTEIQIATLIVFLFSDCNLPARCLCLPVTAGRGRIIVVPKLIINMRGDRIFCRSCFFHSDLDKNEMIADSMVYRTVSGFSLWMSGIPQGVYSRLGCERSRVRLPAWPYTLLLHALCMLWRLLLRILMWIPQRLRPSLRYRSVHKSPRRSTRSPR